MIRSEASHLKAAAQSHPGMTGKNNEDRYAVSAYRMSSSDPTPAVLAVLCDGIGGHRAGEVAAELAVETISQVIAGSDGRRPLDQMQEAITRASQQIYQMAAENPERQGMGATCACAWVIGDRLYTASVGDSRIYLVRGAAISQLTVDHTWVQEALERGVIKPENARNHPNAHVIRRFLGSPNPPEVDFRLRLGNESQSAPAEANQGARLQPGDRLLLCSDGLTDLVDDAEILQTLTEKTPEEAVQSLIDQANALGGHDNITIITLQVPTRRRLLAAPPGKLPPERWPLMAVGCGSLALIALVVALALSGLGLLDLLQFRATRTPSPTPSLPPVLQTALPEATGLPGSVPYAPSPSPETAAPRPTVTPAAAPLP